MGANVNVPYVAVGFDLVFCYSVLLTPHLHIVKLLENRWIIAFLFAAPWQLAQANVSLLNW